MNKKLQQKLYKSGKTCEICGKPGKLTGISWFQTLCAEHKK